MPCRPGGPGQATRNLGEHDATEECLGQGSSADVARGVPGLFGLLGRRPQRPWPLWREEKNVVKGKATDTAGKPLAGVEVVADNQVLYDSNVVGVTGTDGTYRLELGQAATTWNASARLKRDFNGRSYTFELHPSNATPSRATRAPSGTSAGS